MAVTVSKVEASHFNTLGLQPTLIWENLLLTKLFKRALIFQCVLHRFTYMPISQARILRHWAHDILQREETLEGNCSFILAQEKVYPLTLWLQLFYSRQQHERPNKHDGSHEPQVETTAGASSCSHLSLQNKRNWSSLEFKVRWKFSWGSSQQNPWVTKTASLKTGDMKASAQNSNFALETVRQVLLEYALL